MKIYGTQLPGTMDAIIKNTIAQQSFSTRKELMRYFRQPSANGDPLFLSLLSAALPNWEDLTGASDPVKYVMNSKLLYRVKKFMD